ncbi:MAG: hypothetical protein GF311_11630 [Candidatus Lokiarchaeota archaeon]|nr:hypothetical protein [Candidatus Lokiarchaeota archaeon]
MPTFGHVFYGLCLLIPIFYYTRNKFNYKVAFIFFANMLYGPDIVWLFFDTPFHSILGFAILALPLAMVYSYASRFALKRSEKGFPLKFVDEELSEVKWRNAYILTVAGGISHFFIDQFFHFEESMWIWSWPDISITYDQMLAWGGPLYHVFDPLMVIGEIIVVVTILASLYYFRKGYKETFKAFVIVSVVTFVIMLLGALGIGNLTAVFGGERELAVMAFGLIYILIPLFMLMYVARDVEENTIMEPDQPKVPREQLLKIVATLSLILALFFILYGVVAILFADTLVDLIHSLTGTTYANTKVGLIFLGAYYGTISVILLIGSTGLFFKNNICRYLVIGASTYLFILGFPLAIALFLCENQVKEIFRK